MLSLVDQKLAKDKNSQNVKSRKRLEQCLSQVRAYASSTDSNPRLVQVRNSYDARKVHEEAERLGLDHFAKIDENMTQKKLVSIKHEPPYCDLHSASDCPGARFYTETQYRDEPVKYVVLERKK